MATPYAAYTASAGQRDFDVTFPFINRSHVIVRVNGAQVAPLSWLSDTRLRLPSPAAGGDFVEIERSTPIEQQLVKFQDGNVLTAEDLNIAVQQSLYRQQELSGQYERAVMGALVRLAGANGITIPVEGLMDEIVAELAENATVQNFKQRVNEIDLNAGNILSQAQQLIDLGAEIDGVNLRADSIETTAANLEARADGLRTDLTTLTGIVDSLAGGDPGTGIATLIQDEENARIAGDQALVDTISLIGARSGDNLAFIADLDTLKVSPTESFSQRFSALSASDAANAAAIVSEETARITAISAEAARIDLLTTRMGDAEADIVSEQSARIDADAAIAADVSLLTTRMGDAEAAIVTEQSARSSADAAIASDVTALTTRMGDAEAAIVTEQTARSNADSALAADVSALVTRMGDAEAAITDEATARSTADTAEANARQALAARVTTAESDIAAAEAAILSEQTARANGDSALTSSLNALTARVGTAESDILSEQTARANADGALASDISGLLTRVDDAEAAIVTEQTARANGDSANAQAITALTTTVNGNTASVNTLQSSVDGLEARYGVTLDVNGYVTGFAQNNDGQTGVFQILADKFQIVDPAGGAQATPFVPFEVSDGIVKIRDAAIGNLSVDRLTNGTMSANITQDGDLTMGSGRIIFDNGTYMKVAGVGFGSQNQFIEWFGPKMPITSCTESNAIQYLKTNGDAYFGGSLSAGVLKNAATSTSIASDASITVGPFGSNGDPITVVTSYSIESRFNVNYSSSQGSQWDSAVSAWGATPQTFPGTLDQSVDETKAMSTNITVAITRNGVSWGTLTITSGVERIQGNRPNANEMVGGNLTYTRTFVGTITSTDNVGGTSDRTFVATITSRAASAVTGSITSQKLSIVATEE